MTLYHWSQTAANNATADITCPFPEGQAPSSVNDGTRGMMAAVAKFRDDISGQIATTGTSTAYSVSSFQGFDSLADMHGKEIWFTPNVTNTAGSPDVSLNCDGLGAKPLRLAPGAALPSGVIVQGTPYGAIYNNTDGAFYLKSSPNPFIIPIGAGFDYWAATAPNSSFVFPIGQAISRTTYASLFSGNPWSIGTTYGAGDGSTTFNLPDKRGRVSVAPDNGAGRINSAIANASTPGSVGGAQNETLALANLPNFAPGFTGSPGSASSTNSNVAVNANSPGNVNLGGTTPVLAGTVVGSLISTFTPAGTVGSINGGQAQTAFNTVQPSIVCNYIMRII